ncbi:unnamed protein product [Peniophora sp. CBMAI 1063]|nr:unnamed protein product [Peniophora sp. CBMAI 1063]
MSDAEDSTRNAGASRGTKRRKLVACDMCRRRKIKCDEKLASTGKCSNCSTFDWNCTYAHAPSRLFAPGYVEVLELKIQKLEALIERVLPGRDFSSEVGFKLTRTNWMEPGVLGDSVSSGISSPSTFVTLSSGIPSNDTPLQQSGGSDGSDDEEGDLLTKLQHLSLTGPAIIRSWGFSNYLGRSSAAGMVLAASKLLRQLRGPSEGSGFHLETTPKWVSTYILEQESTTAHFFPAPDLLYQLIDLYFRYMNVFTPILHRPTFERELSTDMHLRNKAFGGVTLLVCALGALVSKDPRVLIPDDGDAWHSAGWAWFRQVQVMDRSFVGGEKLYGLQIAALATLFMARTFSPVHAWMFAGFGVRLAQNVGAHRRRAYGSTITAQDEQYRRVTWVLFRLDLLLSKGLGRPCNIQEDEFDLSLPQCCDDEYWMHEDPKKAFKQPEGRPSYMSYFICTIKLSQIMHLALRTVYANARTRARSGFTGKEWLLETISRLDSLLNEWSDSVPDHLRDPSRADGLFFLQSIGLWLFYHEMRIVIHRPFIIPFDDASKPFPAFATCVNASRSLVSLMTSLEDREPDQILILPAEAICNAAVLSVIAVAAHKLRKMALDVEHAQRDATACLAFLENKVHRWRWGARFLAVFRPLMAVFDTPDASDAPSGLLWDPEEVSSWLPAATGRKDSTLSNESTENLESGHPEAEFNITSNFDAFSDMNWDVDWALLANAPPGYDMDRLDSITAFDEPQDYLHSAQQLVLDPASEARYLVSEGANSGDISTLLPPRNTLSSAASDVVGPTSASLGERLDDSIPEWPV